MRETLGRVARYAAVVFVILLLVLVPEVETTQVRCTTCEHGSVETVWRPFPFGPELSRRKEPLTGRYSACDRHAFMRVTKRSRAGLIGMARYALGI
jgi:hypothetical protein